MHRFILVGLLLFSVPAFSQAQKSKKAKLNTNLYEKEAQETSITGKVKTVREIQGETEVFIDNPKGNSGPYILPENFKNRAKILEILKKSQKPGGSPVTVSIDDQQHIKSVEESESSAKSHPEWDF